MWEIAGTAMPTPIFSCSQGWTQRNPACQVGVVCGIPRTHGPHTFRSAHAIHALTRWTRHTPAQAVHRPRLSVQIVTSPAPAALVNRDPGERQCLGGIRLPQVAVTDRDLTGIAHPQLCRAILLHPVGATDPWDGDSDPWMDSPVSTPPRTAEPSLSLLYGT